MYTVSTMWLARGLPHTRDLLHLTARKKAHVENCAGVNFPSPSLKNTSPTHFSAQPLGSSFLTYFLSVRAPAPVCRLSSTHRSPGSAALRWKLRVSAPNPDLRRHGRRRPNTQNIACIPLGDWFSIYHSFYRRYFILRRPLFSSMLPSR